MSDRTALIIAAAVTGTVAILIFLIDRQVKKKGSLFAGPLTFGMRLLAFIFGLLLAGMTFLEWVLSSEQVSQLHLALPVAAAALFAFSFGSDRLLNALRSRPDPRARAQQPAEEESLYPDLATFTPDRPPIPVNSILRRLLRILGILAIGVVGIAAAFFGLLWAHGQISSGSMVGILLVVLIVGFLYLAPILHSIMTAAEIGHSLDQDDPSAEKGPNRQ